MIPLIIPDQVEVFIDQNEYSNAQGLLDRMKVYVAECKAKWVENGRP